MLRSIHLNAAVAVAAVVLTGCQLQSTTKPAGEGEASSHRETGEKAAKASIAAGELLIKEYPPLPSPAWQGDYVAAVKKLGIGYEVPSLPKDVKQADFIEQVRGWNSVMEAEIDKKHGAGTLARLHAEAKKKHEDAVKKK